MSNATALRETLSYDADRKIKELRSVKKWLATPKMAKILDSLDYLAEKYKADVIPYTDGGNTAVYMTLRGLTGLKDESLAALLYSMEHHEANTSSTDDDAASYARTYRYRWSERVDGVFHYLSVNITANFDAESDTCKRVIVGYREPSTEATPIYKLECSDATAVTEDDNA